MPTPLAVVIEATQYTDGQEPVIVHFSAASGTGLFANTTQCHTTQTALIARIDPAIAANVGDRWSDAEVQAELLAYLDANGISATIAGAA